MPKNKKKTIAAAKADGDRRSVGKIIAILCCSLVVLLLLGLAGACYYLFNFDFNGTILENVTIAGVDVGGMTRQEAISAVESSAQNAFSTEPMVVKVFDVAVEVMPDVANPELNTTLAVWDAYRYGRRGFANLKAQDRQTAANEGIAVDITNYLSLDEEGIQTALDAFSDHYNTTLSQSTYEITGTAPELTLVVNLGIPEYGLDLNVLFEDVLKAYRSGNLLLETECAMLTPAPIDLETILKENATEPVDAYFNKETFDVIEGVNGCNFDIASVQAKIDETPFGQTVEIPFDQIAPATTGDMLRATLFRDVLGSHTATQSSSSSRQTNLRLACEAVNGVILLPGDTFSYNQTLGERTAERGYQYGTAYVNGESVPSIGGGICQVSSTIYYCALQADLEILERENHCYAPGYVPLGMDATVSWGVLDFCFRNNQDYPIRIDAVADGGSTTVNLMGTDTKDYYVKMEYEVTATYNYKTVYQDLPANNEKGYKDGECITSPITGYDVITYRCKYNKETNELISRDYEAKSNFSKRDEVICRIIGAGNPTPGTPPAPGIGNGGVTDEGGALPD